MFQKRWAQACLAVAAVTVLLLGYLSFELYRLPDVRFLARENPTETALMRARGPKRIQEWVALEDVSRNLVRAVLMGEDAGFYGHNGFDSHEIKEAFRRNWEEGRTVRGASTITQQLAKNLFLSTERTYTRKLREAALTRRLEEALTKDRILEIYLNVIEWGDGVYGAQAASFEVYGKPASALSPAEAATLAAMIPSPLRLHPCARPDSVRTRRDRILNWMHGANDLSDAELETALRRPLAPKNCP